MGRVVINEDLCKGCELCTGACPRHLLALGTSFNRQGYRAVVFEQDAGNERRQCTGCALCAWMCPDVAITVYK